MTNDELTERAREDRTGGEQAVYEAYEDDTKGEVYEDEYQSRLFFFRGWTRGHEAGYALGQKHAALEHGAAVRELLGDAFRAMFGKELK
jgi:hypothetical protein